MFVAHKTCAAALWVVQFLSRHHVVPAECVTLLSPNVFGHVMVDPICHVRLVMQRVAEKRIRSRRPQ